MKNHTDTMNHGTKKKPGRPRREIQSGYMDKYPHLTNKIPQNAQENQALGLAHPFIPIKGTIG